MQAIKGEGLDWNALTRYCYISATRIIPDPVGKPSDSMIVKQDSKLIDIENNGGVFIIPTAPGGATK